MISAAFDLTKLSVREHAILEAAIEGLTDIQIAQRLDISQSTVNSYWVRIRGKLGQLSRTELVALALKQRAQNERAELNARLEELQNAADAHARISVDYENAEIFRAALDAMPEAVFVACQRGLVRYANSRLEAMFGYGEGELTDGPVSLLVPKTQREVDGRPVVDHLRSPHPVKIGLRNVVFGQRQDGTQFRIVVLVDSRPTSNGPIYTCVVRDFTNEIDTRQQYASTWS
jgi:PAS domain S-box-containing protein